jgi:branched-chain amino acid transport system ATP-binding protein
VELMLQIEKLEARYGGNQALKGISLEVRQGEIVSLIGANGAGKTTLLNCLSGIHPARKGKIVFMGQDISRSDAQQLVRLGIIQVPENRQLFGPLTIQENLEMGAYVHYRRKKQTDRLKAMERVYGLFPVLKARRTQRAATLSGGEQQMLAIGRGLMADPRLLLLDEPSLGLAPMIVREIFHIIKELKEEGCTILLVEQNARGALNISQRGYVIETGRITLSGTALDLLRDGKVRRAFLGQDLNSSQEV